ncbi:MAG: hypothetical protein R3A78_12090 [Polyangiales bacterium]|nr:hypothetical protein [Myxococcales bacterium]
MGKKTFEFKARAERAAKPARKPKPKRPKRNKEVDTAAVGVSATDRKVGKKHTADRNRSKSAARKGGAVLEDSQTGKPSRKSTRKSEGHVKRSSNLQRRAVRKTHSPQARAARSGGRSK